MQIQPVVNLEVRAKTKTGTVDDKEIVGISFARPISTLTTQSQRSPEKHRQLMRFNVDKVVEPVSAAMALSKKSRKIAEVPE